MYKLSQTLPNRNGGPLEKAKPRMFLLGCVHGWEVASSFNLYVLAKELCDATNEDTFYMKLRNSFDIYIVPCVNGYGIYHSLRVNGNGVNINRNFPCSDWAQDPSSPNPGDNDYAGSSAGSESIY
jgi:murein tripeptide amidase MpaA